MSKKIIGIVVFGVVVVAAAALVIGLRSSATPGSSSAASGPGCWRTSQYGSVVTQEEVGEVCLDTGELMTFATEGGTYTEVRGPLPHGPLVCSMTPSSGPNTWKVWTGPGDSSSSDAVAVAFCNHFKADGGSNITFTWGPGQPASAPQAVPTTGYWYDQGYSYAASNIAPDPAAYSESGSTPSALCADAMFPNPDQGTPEVSPVPGSGLQTQEWAAGCESGASSSAASSPAPAPPPTPSPTPTVTYTYAEGYAAASQVTVTAINTAWANSGAIGPGWMGALNWCGTNDRTPDTGDVDEIPTYGSGTPWYKGCVAEMAARGLVTQAELQEQPDD
jgi:hypothetical protein